MIVMEFLDGMPLYRTKTSEHNTIVCDVESAITLLHSHDLVFGDLHSTNIILHKIDGKTRAMLVDFDWCGQHQKSCYPPRINSAIKWPDGVRSCALLDKAHDLHWLKILREKNNWFYESIEAQ